MQSSFFLLVILLAIALIPNSAKAGQGFLGLSIGYYNIIDSENAANFRLEYRPSHSYWKNLKPWAGLDVTSEGSIWAGGGLLYDFKLSPHWYITPSIGLGLYRKGSSDLDLGYPVTFRSQLELAYQFDCQSRAGIAFSHTSNGSLDEKNPGTEILSLYWHMPY